MKKVLHIRSSGEFLGAENVVLQLSKFASEFGYEAHICVIHDFRDPYPLLAEYAKTAGIKHTVITARKRIDLNCVKEIKHIISSEKIDIINTHGYKEDLYTFLAFTNIPVLATNHLWKKTNRTLRLYAFIDTLVLTRFQKIVAVSKAIYDEMRGITYLRNRDMCVISNGIDYESFGESAPEGLRSSLNIDPKTPMLLTVSSLTPEKGHKYLLNALASPELIDQPWHLAIVGGGREEAALNSQVEALSLSRKVTFLGYRKDVHDLLAIADLYILPSLDEGLPMALLEAMAAGKPCIATDVGDIAKVLREDPVGKLIAPGSALALQTAIGDALNSAEWRSNAGQNARELIKNEFSSRSMTQNYSNCYDTILNVKS